jgi:hypothetical protein
MPVVPTVRPAHARTTRRRRFAGLAVAAALCLTIEVADPGGAATTPVTSGVAQQVQTLGASKQAARHPRVILGAVGSVGGLARDIHHRLARHYYRVFSQDVPRGGRMITANSSTRWAAVARMRPGSRIYADVARWGRTLARRNRMTLFAYSHEPEITSKRYLGTPLQFKRAFRKVVQVMRAHGATNVRYTWQMTGWSFRVNPASRMRAGRWYPGDRWVDVVGPDEYNWFTCGEGARRWVSLGEMARPALRFAAAHHKKLAIPEFASVRNARRARWVRSGHAFLANNRARVVAAFYFQHPPTNPANRDCRWKLTRQTEFRAFGRMAHREVVFRQ